MTSYQDASLPSENLAAYVSGLCQREQAIFAEFGFQSNPETVLRARSQFIDDVLQNLWRYFALPPQLALVAVGGYGRGELYPYSDIDILILEPITSNQKTRSALEDFITCLWDIGWKIGHGVRTLDECVTLAEEDLSVFTSMLESRLISGNQALLDQLQQLLQTTTMADPLRFYRAKRAEQEERHSRYQDSVYALEPNCKESPGGLRDVHVMLWLAMQAGLAGQLSGLRQKRLINKRELAQLERAVRWMHILRIHVHLLAKRNENRLLFDFQYDLAKILHVSPRKNRRLSEILMQRYFRVAKTIRQINAIVTANIGVAVNKASIDNSQINARFAIRAGSLDLIDEQCLRKDKSAIFETILILQNNPQLRGVTAKTLRALWRARNYIDENFRSTPAYQQQFLSIWQQPKGVVHALKRMHQLDLLSAYIPHWQRIVGQMQYDLFHAYTVDEHTLLVIRNLRRMTMNEFEHEHPLCSELIATFDRHWLLYIAALFHDIGKGRGGDHSQIGAEIVKEFCAAHNFSLADSEMIVWLVANHLTMSLTAQKKDIQNPEVIADFSRLVGNQRYLTALYLLTVADIKGTSPKVWTPWKSHLLETLFQYTLTYMTADEPAVRLADIVSERQQEVVRWLRLFGHEAGQIKARWRGLDRGYFLRHHAKELRWHALALLRAKQAGSSTVVRVLFSDQSVKLLIVSPDKKALLVNICGVIASLGFLVIDSKAHTTDEGWAIDSFVLNSSHARKTLSYYAQSLQEALLAQIDQPVHEASPFTLSKRISRLARHFPLAPKVTIRPSTTSKYAVLELIAADRPSLLYDAVKVCDQYQIKIHRAFVNTLGERVEDSFLISNDAVLTSAKLSAKFKAALMHAMQ